MTGKLLTVMTTESVLIHPFASVPETEYVVVVEGFTVIEVVVAPVFHR